MEDSIQYIIESRIDELIATGYDMPPPPNKIESRINQRMTVVRIDELKNLKKKLINNVDQEWEEESPEEIMYSRSLFGYTLNLFDLASPEQKSETNFTPDLLVKLPVDPMLLLSEKDFILIHDLIPKLNSSYFLIISILGFIDHAKSWLQMHTDPEGDARMVRDNLNWIISALDAKVLQRNREEPCDDHGQQSNSSV